MSDSFELHNHIDWATKCIGLATLFGARRDTVIGMSSVTNKDWARLLSFTSINLS